MTQEIADNPKHSHKDELFPVDQKIVGDNIIEYNSIPTIIKTKRKRK